MKTWVLLIGLVGLVAVATACGSEATATPKPTEPPSPTEEPTTAPEATAAPEPTALEAITADEIVDIVWQWAELIETMPAAQSVVADPENYTLTLFSDDRVSIKADCNMVSGSYTLEGNSLTIELGPSTMAFCGEESLDQQYLALLAGVSEAGLENGRLNLHLKENAGRMVFDNSGPATPESTEAPSTETLANMEYKSGFTQSGTALISSGEYREPAAPGSATEIVVRLTENLAVGQLADGQQAAAVILVTDPGGSGTFYELAVVVEQNGQPVNVATTLLGDRVKIDSLSIENGEIVVDMITQGPDDPFCCPTQQVVNTYSLQGDQLVQTSSEVIGTVETGGGETDIVEVIWNWEGFSDTAGQSDIVVPNPNLYRLFLQPDGSFGFLADCNVGGGTYTRAGSSLTLELGPSTLAFCGEKSLDQKYLALLGQVATYVLEGDTMVLNLMADAGNMKFSKLHAVTGRVIAEGNPTLPEGTTVEIQVNDVSRADAPATQVGGVAMDVISFPINFEAPYDPDAIDPRYTYGLNVRVTDSVGKLLYINTQAYNVLTRDFPTYNVEVMVEPVGAQSPDAGGAEIVDVLWKWESFTDPLQSITVDNPDNYTVQFMPDGKVAAKADCNNGSGSYTIDGSSITIEILAMTRAMCAPESLSDLFIEKLNAAAIHFTEGDALFIDLMMDSGTMKFVQGE